MEREDVSGRDVTAGAEAPEAALEDAEPAQAPSGAEITAGEAAPEQLTPPDEEPDPESTAG
jgi:hypothetical protein